MKKILNTFAGTLLIIISAYLNWFVIKHAYRMFTDPIGNSFVIRLLYGPIKIVEPVSSMLFFVLSACGLVCGLGIIKKKQNTKYLLFVGALAITLLIVGFAGAILK